MKISSKWIKHTRTKEERQEVVGKLMAARPAIDLLIKIITEEMKLKVRLSKKKEAYDSPSWAYLQADAIGEERAYLSVLKLLDLKLEENPSND